MWLNRKVVKPLLHLASRNRKVTMLLPQTAKLTTFNLITLFYMSHSRMHIHKILIPVPDANASLYNYRHRHSS